MKKFSFKKLATVSLFFTSIIFTSAFTTYFIPIVSTSHSSDQPNATKIDLHDYDGKTLPEFYKPEPLDNIKEILIGQLENIESTRPVGWEDWECYPNQFEDFVPTLSDTGGSFVLTAKPNAVNYVGSRTATISFNYIDSSKTDISTIITNIQLTTDTNAFSATPSSQQLLTQLKQVNQNARINSLTVDPSTAVWDKTHVIVGDETHSGSYKVTVSVKPNDLIYTGTVDVYYLVKRNQATFSDVLFTLPSTMSYDKRTQSAVQIFELLLVVLSCNSLEYHSILTNKTWQWVRTQDTDSYTLTISSDPLYLDITQTFSITIDPNTTDYFTLTYDQLNVQSQFGWSGWTAGSMRFYKMSENSNCLYLIDETVAASGSNARIDGSLEGVDPVVGSEIIDPNTNYHGIVSGFISMMWNDLERGPFGSLSSTNLKGSLTINSEFCLNIPRNFVRYELGLNSVNMPTNSNIQYCGSNSFLNCTVPNIVVPASCNYFSYACFGRTESGLGVPTPSTLTFKSEQFVGYMPNDGTTYASILYGLRYTPLGDGTGKGRLYVKNETLRQQYINDPNWSTLLKTGPDGPTLEDMIQVDQTN